MLVNEIVQELYGECTWVLHPFLATNRHLDWYVYAPNERYPYWKILSDNLSSLDLSQNCPREYLYAHHVEVLQLLPDFQVRHGQTRLPWYEKLKELPSKSEFYKWLAQNRHSNIFDSNRRAYK